MHNKWCWETNCTQKTTKTHGFWSHLPKQHFILMFWRYIVFSFRTGCLPKCPPQQECMLIQIAFKLEAQWAEPASLTFHSALRKLNTEPSIGASHQISVHFGQAVSEKKIFRNRPIRNKNCLWRPCFLMDQDKMSNLYRGPSIDASY